MTDVVVLLTGDRARRVRLRAAELGVTPQEEVCSAVDRVLEARQWHPTMPVGEVGAEHLPTDAELL